MILRVLRVLRQGKMEQTTIKKPLVPAIDLSSSRQHPSIRLGMKSKSQNSPFITKASHQSRVCFVYYELVSLAMC